MATQRGSPGRVGLSARLLLLTVFFVLLAEVLIYVPSIARFRIDYLEERLVRAHLAALALDAAPGRVVGEDLEHQLLAHSESHGIVLIRQGGRMLSLWERVPPPIDAVIDLRQGNAITWIADAIRTLRQDDNRILRLIGSPPLALDVVVETVIDETPLRLAMYRYSVRIIQLSVIISLIAAALVFVSLQWMMVRPIRRLTAAMTDFSQDPEDETRAIHPSSRTDEIGVAERELAAMQGEVRAALRQKTRLATLGAAVAKVNHDLRNSLATAALVSDKLSNIEDPEVQKVTPRLYGAIDRAIGLCSQTLTYVGDVGPILKPEPFHMAELLDEVRAGFRGGGESEVFRLTNRVPFGISPVGDRSQLFRVFSNLVRNSHEAGASQVTIEGRVEGGKAIFDVIDNGRGIQSPMQQKLFQPFVRSTRKGGAGLGLAICRDIMRAHGGDIQLLATSDKGTTFQVILPSVMSEPENGSDEV